MKPIVWLFILCLLIVIPIVFLLVIKASLKWAILGVISWLIGIALKAAISYGLSILTKSKLPITIQSTFDGFISAMAELGAAAFFLSRTKLDLPDVLAFGIGIGLFEIFFTMFMAVDEISQEKSKPPTLWESISWISGMFIIERALTLVGHTASRIIVYIAIVERWLLPAFCALAIFSFVDGFASYGVLAKWDWASPVIKKRLYVVLVITTILEVVLAYFFWNV